MREPLPPRPDPSVILPPGERAPLPGERAPLPGEPSGLPPLPDVFHTTLRDGLTDLGLDIPPERLELLDGYVRLLLAWTQAINLTAIREPGAVARDHLLDSLSAVAILREAKVRSILDLGSGGGLPGIPLAIALPDVRVLLVESVGKKARFLATAVAAPGLAGRVEVAVERAEGLARPGRQREAFDAVTVRAVAALPELIELAFPLLRVGGLLLAWKREPFAAELAAGRNAARAIGGDVEVVGVRATGLDGHVLVVATKRRPTPGRFPRPPVERRANPL